MFCPFCGNQNRDGKKFCSKCGRTMPPPRTSPVTTALPDTDYADDPGNNAAMMAIIQQSVDPAALAKPVSAVEPMPKWSAPAHEPTAESPSRPNANINAGFNGHPPPAAADSEASAVKAAGANAGLTVEEFDELSQFTQPLLPDTVDFEIPKSLPPYPGNGDNGYDKPANGLPSNSQQASSFAAFGSEKTGALEKSSDAGVALSSAFFEDTYDHTDELEILDRTMDKTAEVPVVSSTQKEEEPPPSAIVTERPATGILSVFNSADNSLQLEQTQRNERLMIMGVVVAFMAGVAFLIWLFFG